MTDVAGPRHPYPGLRAFTRKDTDLFFGREDCVDALVDLLAEQHFLAVLGSSGSGKSSLVKTGLLDALELGLMAQAGSRWRIVDFRPGNEPLHNLARALLLSEANAPSDEDIASLDTFLTRGPRSVIEWCNDGHLGPGENLLLLVDQFEELFRYREYAGREQAEAFVALLLESSNLKASAPIYVVLTMRSEYLGACALIEGLAQRLNAGQFLTPRMTREQCRSAIEGPAAVCDIKIEPTLVNRLLNELANFAPWEEADGTGSINQLDRLARRADQLPLLQHALNHMWRQAGGALAPSMSGLMVLGLADYEAIGGLQGALDRHAEEVLDGLGEGPKEIAGSVFGALTSGATVADAVRRPTPFEELVAICGGDQANVRTVVEAFRAPGCNFLLPDAGTEIKPGTEIDISHESVIRQWRRLSDWVEAEARDAQQWRRLTDAAELEYRHEGGLLQGLNLQYLLDWRAKAKPTNAWARRCAQSNEAEATAFDRAMVFLDRSHAAFLAGRRRQRTWVAAGLGVCLLMAAGTGYGALAIQDWVKAEIERAANREQQKADNEIRKDVEATLGKENIALKDVKAVFDNGYNLYRPLAKHKDDVKTDYSKYARRIIDIFQDVYSNRLDTSAVRGKKPFNVFDMMFQTFEVQSSEADHVIRTLGEIGKSYIEKNSEVALLAYAQIVDTYFKYDKTFLKFQDTLTDLMEGLKDNVRQNHVEGDQSDLRSYDFALQVLQRRIDQKGVTIRTKEVVADILIAKMEIYLETRDARAQQMRDAAEAIYREIDRQSPDAAELKQKIGELRTTYRELQTKYRQRR